MKENEIRTGNWYLGFDNKPKQWTLKDFSLLTDCDGERALDVDEIIKSPIPLTEQWLLDLGFKFMSSKNGQTYYHINGWTVLYTYGSWFYSTSSSITVGRKIQHVNQLQNLFFALTGEELTKSK